MNQSSRDAPNISDADWIRSPATQQVFALLNQQGFVGRAVGGCVRNSLLVNLHGNDVGRIAPVTDIDFATTASPSDTLQLAAAAGLRTVPTGLQHGTVTVIADGDGFEVTTLRQDIATDGRHADVAFTDDWALDAARRDLTINALYADADGTIFDPLGGMPDIHHKRVRFVGNARARIQEDFLRILRFFRFFAQYGDGEPDQDGIKACVAERHGLARLSRERIHQELMKLLVSPGVVPTVQLMYEHGLLTEILPTVPQLTRFVRLVTYAPHSAAALRLAALSILTRENSAQVAQHLRLSKDEASVLNLTASIQETKTGEAINDVSARRLLYVQGSRDYRMSICLYRMLNPDRLQESEWEDLIQLPDRWQPPTFPITGHDLIEFGAQAGPILGNALRTLEKHWLNSDFEIDRSSLLAKAQILIKQHNEPC